MAWEPATLQLKKVTSPNQITTADYDVKIVIEGAGFKNGGSMFGTFMLLSDQPIKPEDVRKREHMIPCNFIKLDVADYQASLHICPRRKTVGKYYLVLWNEPPPNVMDKDGEKHEKVPVNDLVISTDLITVVDGGLPPLDEELASAEKALRQFVESR